MPYKDYQKKLENNRNWRTNNKTRSQEIERRRNQKRPNRNREMWLKKRYNITVLQYEALLRSQDGHCALFPRTEQKHKLHVDHDHHTNKIRGLLCGPCNRALGVLGDNKEGLLRALAYLENV